MRALYLRRLAEVLAVALAALVALPLAVAADETPPAPVELQLDVSLNGQPTGLLARFADLGDGRFASPASELRELGLKVPAATPDSELVPLDGFPGVSYVYDEQKQAIAIEIADDYRVTKSYDARGERDLVKTRPSGYGAVLNYDLFGATGGEDVASGFGSSNYNGLNASLDARLLSPHGVLNQTAIVGMTLADQTDFLRLDTTYTFSDEDNLVTWKGGDFTSGGVAWSRPVRLGGIQVQRTFSMRPDLVTSPLPAVSGSAAVPSTVDVFVNGVKSYSQQVGAGPYQIDNVPSIAGSGVAQVVTRDAAGRETVQSLSFYTSPQLLRPGFYDFSVEAGLPRSDYGFETFGYDSALAGSVTVRSGLSDWLTLETHAEAGDGVLNGGGGIVARAFDAGIVSAAASASTSSKGTGTQLYASFESKIGAASINLRSQHAFGDYEDLARITAHSTSVPILASGFGGGFFNFVPPRAVDAATVSLPIQFDTSNISATYLRYEPETGEVSQLVSATYSRPLISNANLFATGYIDLNNQDGAGLYLGVSMPLGDNISLSTGASQRAGDLAGYADASSSLKQEPGSWGWRIRDYEGSAAYRTAAVSHQTTAAKLETSLRQDTGGVRGTAEVEGSIALLGGDVYMANRIDDSFAVVDAHSPGVKVQRDNTLVGETNDDGKILIPSLTSYQQNKISIDPMDLPLDAEIDTTVDHVAPSFKSGVYVEFDVRKARPSAIVVLTGADGAFLPAGSEVHLAGSVEPFIVGYDGQAFIKGLDAVNTIHVTAAGRDCSAQFTYAPSPDIQPVIGPEVCQ